MSLSLLCRHEDVKRGRKAILGQKITNMRKRMKKMIKRMSDKKKRKKKKKKKKKKNKR